MNLKFLISSLFLFSSICIAGAQSYLISDFDSYADTAALRAEWSSFGNGAQDGAPSLSEGTGIGNPSSNAAVFTLTWGSGSSANAVFGEFGSNGFTLPTELQDLSNYGEISFFALLSNTSDLNSNTLSSSSTLVKVAFEGGDAGNTVWQSTNGTGLVADNNYSQYSLSLNDVNEMSSVGGGNDSFENTIQNVKNIRLQFENTSAGSNEFVFLDNITAVPEPSSYALLIGLGGLSLAFYRRYKQVKV